MRGARLGDSKTKGRGWLIIQTMTSRKSKSVKISFQICVLRKETNRSSFSATPVGRGSFSAAAAAATIAASAQQPADTVPPSTDPANLAGVCESVQDSIELRKIKKVQSFFRGWLCRRRWKQIVEEYIKSPHAESMRKRNSLVFSMVEAEEEYLEQLEVNIENPKFRLSLASRKSAVINSETNYLQVLVSCFLRPFKMAASSKRPPCSHEDVNSIFLNSETVLFLHQIFLKGLTSRLESWPTLVLGIVLVSIAHEML